MSFKVEVLADNSGRWAGNGLVFETEREAEAYGRDLHRRWLLVRRFRVLETDEAPNYRFLTGRLEAVE